MIREILLKEPPKSLVRFKSLSKSFCNLIESLGFISSSYSIVFIYSPVMNVRKLLTWRPKIANQPSLQEMSINKFPSNRYIYFLCCSDGLLCFRICCSRFDQCMTFNCSVCETYLLWNPISRSSLTIPACKGKAYKLPAAFGIGVVGPENAIKLVFLSKFRSKAHVFDAPPIWRRKLSSWREIEDPRWPLSWFYRIELIESEILIPKPCGRRELSSWREIEIPIPKPSAAWGDGPMSLDTTLHWLAKPKSNANSYPQCIQSFHLVTEVFTQILMPHSIAWSGHTTTVLVAFKGQLGFFVGKFETEFDLWVMKEYGESKSWTIRHRIRDIPRLEQSLQVWNDCHLLIRFKPPGSHGFGLLLYDPDNGTTREIDLHCINVRMAFAQVNICNYKKSLI